MEHLAGLGLAGVIVGFVVGLTGMGGGALLTPVMVLVFGIPPSVAVSSDLVVSLAIKPFGAKVHQRAGTVNWSIVAWLAAGSVPAAFAGSAAAPFLLGPRADAILASAIGAVLLVAVALLVVRPALTRSRRDALASADPLVVRPAVTMAIGLLGGLLVGLTSVGSGSLMIALLLLAHPTLSLSELVGTDLAQAVPLVAAAALGHLLFGDVRFGLVAPLVLGAVPGVLAGGLASAHLPERVVRPVLAIVLASSGLKLLGFI
ncbi:MAG: sulfite exporter TauE/SafE family protein [Acidimicrobiia bacterium]|nr:sulfite exporter TauE/SafE family protein [Acidimicrobiia bacterium]